MKHRARARLRLHENTAEMALLHRGLQTSKHIACPVRRQSRALAEGRRQARTAAVVTDQAVPEGHKGLHGYLYGEQGAEVHDRQTEYHFRQVRHTLQRGTSSAVCVWQSNFGTQKENRNVFLAILAGLGHVPAEQSMLAASQKGGLSPSLSQFGVCRVKTRASS